MSQPAVPSAGSVDGEEDHDVLLLCKSQPGQVAVSHDVKLPPDVRVIRRYKPFPCPAT